MVLAGHLKRDIHLVRFEPGRIEFRPAPGAPSGLAQDLGRFLRERTGTRWMVSVSRAEGEPTLQERRERIVGERHERARSHPLVQAVLETFPGARLGSVRDKKEDLADSTSAEREIAAGESEEGP